MSASTDKTLCLCFKEHTDDIGGQDGDTGGVHRGSDRQRAGHLVLASEARPPTSLRLPPAPLFQPLDPATPGFLLPQGLPLSPLRHLSPSLPRQQHPHTSPGDPSPSDSMTSTLG